MKSNSKRRRVIWVVSAAVVVAAVILAGGLLFIQRRANASQASEIGPVATAFVGTLSAEASASGQLQAQQEAVLSLAMGGRVERVSVEAGDEVQAGQALVQLERDAHERAVRKAEQTLAIQEARLAEQRKGAQQEDVDAARAAVASSKSQLDDLLAGPRPEELADAEAAVESAQAQLDDILAGASTEQLTDARAALASALAAEKAAADLYAAQSDRLTVARQQLAMAEIDLESAQYFYDALANDWQHKDYAPHSPEAKTLSDAQTAYQVALARYNLAAADINDSAYRGAQAQVAQARANLAALTEEQTVAIAGAREQLAAAQANLTTLTEEKTAQIANARAQLAQAEASLSKLTDGASAEQLAATEAQVEQARIALENARARLDDATLVAPFDGIVTAVHVSAGEWATGRAVELLDPGSIEVILDVDEVDIGGIAVGQPSVITLETWPDQEYAGEVTAIAPKAQTQSEIVTYQVHIRFLPDEMLPVRAGMTANATLTTDERQDVLLIPNRAITVDRQTSEYTVKRVDGDEITEVKVSIGLRDGDFTEITSGLQEGDQVSIAEAKEELRFGPPGRD